MRHDQLPAARFDLADIGSLLGDPTRATIMLALMDGSSRPATELARIAGVSAQTASAHYSRLIAGGLLAVEQRGRHRYYRLENADVAGAIESILSIPAPSAARSRRLRADPRGEAFCRARTCYAHLAGTIAVAIAGAWLADGWLTERGRAFEVTARGRERLQAFGLAAPALRRPGKICLDLTERRPHIGGALGAALLQHCLHRGWFTRQKASRALLLTTGGRRALARHGIRFSDGRALLA